MRWIWSKAYFYVGTENGRKVVQDLVETVGALLRHRLEKKASYPDGKLISPVIAAWQKEADKDFFFF
jgi:hypothetical protein